MNKIKYLGHIIDNDGRRPNPERATAINDMPSPDNITTLQSFLGLTNYYQSYIKKLHDLRAPLNELLKKDKKWRWTPECQTAFDQIKKALTSDLFLKHYDRKLEIIFASDASSYGVGSCILYKMPDGTTIGFLHEVFARFGVVDCVVSDNGTQFTSVEFKEFCEIFQIKHITTPQYHPRSNGQDERFVDTLQRALQKASGTPTDKALQQFLQVYRITPNPNTPLAVSPTETMFARKIRSVFDKILSKQNKLRKTTLVPKKRFNPGEKNYFKKYENNTSCWERGIILKKELVIWCTL